MGTGRPKRREQAMTRNLKVMLLVLLAMIAFGGFATVAQGAQFTAPGAGAGVTTTAKISKDGTGKTSHHVLIIGTAVSFVAFTCEEITGPGHFIGPSPFEVTFILFVLHNCNAAGQAVTVTNTGCNVTFTANGEVHIGNSGAKVCKHGAGNSPIDIEFAGCKVEIGAQTLKGVKYHNLNAAGTTVGSGEGTKVTVEPSITGITYNAAGANCPYGTTSNGSYTTGNTIISGTRPAGTTVQIRWDA